jgi:hypothetical protein
MIIEFGVHHDRWWQTFGQILEYVTFIRSTTETKYVIDQPVLLTVITVNNNNNKSNESGDKHIVARYGMFLCIPKGNYQYRLALLWRVDTYSVDDASQQFGKTLSAAQRCTDMIELLNEDIPKSYQYLGPNCCRIGQYVSVSLAKSTFYVEILFLLESFLTTGSNKIILSLLTFLLLTLYIMLHNGIDQKKAIPLLR